MTIPPLTAENLDDVIKSLEKIRQWFSDNQMKTNRDYCHILLSGKNRVTMSISGAEIKNTEFEKLLGIIVDFGLKFKNYLKGRNFRQKNNSQNLRNRLSRMAHFC